MTTTALRLYIFFPGQKNHRLFMALLTGFVVAESTYTMCSTKYITRCINSGTIRSENPVSLNMVISTMLFSILQVLWQCLNVQILILALVAYEIVFLMWHIYCICFNIKTDEWINWKRYPEFQVRELPQSASSCLLPIDAPDNHLGDALNFSERFRNGDKDAEVYFISLKVRYHIAAKSGQVDT
ncbi:hypothetical protein PR202_ga26204 [Eleusine coracana subsp. coracana]|uniref:Uncharacterized protein n=1 Tax=Eleusine coracana subsp. coracana TaxID=191504 RepID=A0AAV5DCX4_ELECO|nr:hypothetical protein PR202_ga26204 [Eleusine coracana subsp. coracana]